MNVRDEYRYNHPDGLCALCSSKGTDIHEICRGISRKKSTETKSALLLLCRECHNALSNYGIWPLDMQYALKAYREPSLYNRKELNTIRGRSEDSISEQDVAKSFRKVVKRIVIAGGDL